MHTNNSSMLFCNVKVNTNTVIIILDPIKLFDPSGWGLKICRDRTKKVKIRFLGFSIQHMIVFNNIIVPTFYGKDEDI